MRLIIFIAVIFGIAAIFGIVYGINALLQRKRGRGTTSRVTKSVAPDDDPEFLRNLARKLAEEETQKQKREEDEQGNDK